MQRVGQREVLFSCWNQRCFIRTGDSSCQNYCSTIFIVLTAWRLLVQTQKKVWSDLTKFVVSLLNPSCASHCVFVRCTRHSLYSVLYVSLLQLAELVKSSGAPTLVSAGVVDQLKAAMENAGDALAREGALQVRPSSRVTLPVLSLLTWSFRS